MTHSGAQVANKKERNYAMMHTIPAKNKPLIDLTVMDADDWREEIEAEVARLNEMMTIIIMNRRAAA